MTTTDRHRRGKTTVTAPDLTPERRLRLQRLGMELRLTDQILSPDVEAITIAADGPAPAWTTLDGDHIHFALDQMPHPRSRAEVAVWLGTNAHELGHVLYSPRRHSPLMDRIIEGDRTFLRGIAQLANIVEDQRQERLLLAHFAPWRTYLTAALAHHLVADDDSAWLLMCGRTWLPADVRAHARARFVLHRSDKIADEVAAVIGDYQLLTDPGTTESAEAWALLNRLHSIFDGAMPEALPHSCVLIEGGEPDTDTDDAIEDGWPTAGDEPEPGDDESDDTPASGDESDDNREADATGGSSKATSQPDASEPGEGGGSGAGNESAAPPGPISTRKLRAELNDAVDAQLHDDESPAADELDSILDTLRNGGASDQLTGDGAAGSYVLASDEARRLHREVADALLDLKDQSEPGWVRRTDSGRLNAARLANPRIDLDSLFDRFEPGQMDASELDVAVLLDVSGSMSTSMDRLGEAAWAIRHAVDDLEGECSVIAWESGPHRVMAHPGERPDDRMFVPRPLGGTEPLSALTEAYGRLANSSARNRLMVILTDGDWYTEQGAEVIAAMNDAGIVTVCALLGNDAGTSLHRCTYGARIDDPLELARLFGRIAHERIGAWK